MPVQKELVENVLKKLDKTAHTVYAAERIAQRWGVILVRQPPYHCQYNGIELIWAWMKKVKHSFTSSPSLSANFFSV